MRLLILAVGRLRAGPERDLTADYLARAGRTGRPLGLGPAELSEIDERKARGAPAQGAALIAARPAAAPLWLLDARGEALTSPGFAAALAAARDGGARTLALAVAGADGADGALRGAADRQISLGAMIWPHALARVMLAEQIYRATTILAGTPYHRG